ncbi:hypothetical protein [Pseudoalteromonas sp. MMG005]|uniref:hypothetical protein n=1 Tax=Pseudoalteromonas sp. MMG005 TaxID=2822682 RepID=UPI001B39F19D|nr:hypothetical protein [Pseudoalteromonas sp. MMG005]MBQ4845918.1 hypothetical protein [Pseudoalteromonas sp. MMG005]
MCSCVKPSRRTQSKSNTDITEMNTSQRARFTTVANIATERRAKLHKYHPTKKQPNNLSWWHWLLSLLSK